MKRVSKRSWALALALAMILSLFTGLSANAKRASSGLLCSWADWYNDQPQRKPVNDEFGNPNYTDSIGIEPKKNALVYICKDDNNNYDTYLTVNEFNQGISVQKNGTPINDVKIVPYSYHDDKTNKDVTPDKGYFRIYSDTEGSYQVKLNNDLYFDLYINLPEIGVYSSDSDFTVDTYLSPEDNIEYKATEDNTFYAKALNKDAEMVEITSATLYKYDEEQDKDVEFNSDKIRLSLKMSDNSILQIQIAEGFNEYFKIHFKASFTFGAEDTQERDREIYFNPTPYGFMVADPDWRNNATNFNYDPYSYRYERDIDLGDWNEVSFGFIDADKNVTPAPGIVIKDGNGNDIDPNSGMVEVSQENYPDGVYKLRFNHTGDYRVIYNDGIKDYTVIFHVIMPRCGIYSQKTGGEENLVCTPWESFTYEPGTTYYIIARDDIKTDDWLQGASVTFIDKLNTKNVDDWKKGGFSPVAFTIPETLVDDYRDAISVTYSYKDGNIDERRFHLVGSKEGFLIGNSKWDVDEKGIWRDWSINLDDLNEHGESQFSKSRGSALYYDDKVTLGIKTGGDFVKLTKDQLADLYIEMADGSSAAGKYELKMCSYTYFDDEQHKDVEVPIDDVFIIRIFESGDYRLVYNNNGNKQFVDIGAGLGDLSIYGKPFAEEKYIVGGDRTEYNDSRRTFYIVPLNENNDNFTKEFRITKAKADSNEISVSIKDNVVKATLAANTTDKIRVKVNYTVTETKYRYEDGERVVDGDPNEYGQDRDFEFYPSDVLVQYSEEVQKDIDAAEAVIGKINNIPPVAYLKPEDNGNIVDARKAYDKLTDTQKKLVGNEILEKLVAAENAIKVVLAEEEAKAAKIEQDKATAAQNATKAAEQKASQAATAAAEAARAAEKAAVSKAVSQTQAAAKKAQEAAVSAATAKVKSEDQNNLNKAVAQARKTAEDETTKSMAEMKAAFELEKKAAVEEAIKATMAKYEKKPPKKNTIIYDTKSKALYKVTKVATATAAGEVEYVRASTNVKKAKLPETITVDGFKYTLTSIGAKAFEHNRNLKSVIISKNVTKINKMAFSGCEKLKTITVKSKVIKSVGKKAFSGINAKATIKLPKGSNAKYIKKFQKKGQKSTVKVK